MIRAQFGLAKNPFSATDLTLLPQQREVLETLRVHCQQRGLCVIVGEPGTGKSVIKHALCQHDPKRLMTSVARQHGGAPGGAGARFPKPTIFNTDQGSQFTAEAFTSVLRGAGITTISMDGRGRCINNVFVERVWRSLKYEEVMPTKTSTKPERALAATSNSTTSCARTRLLGIRRPMPFTEA